MHIKCDSVLLCGAHNADESPENFVSTECFVCFQITHTGLITEAVVLLLLLLRLHL